MPNGPIKSSDPGTAQRIWVFQQNNSALAKIAALRECREPLFEVKLISIDEALAPIIDDAAAWIPLTIDADLVLDHLQHPDLSDALSEACRRSAVPVIASGKKGDLPGMLNPPICCALRHGQELGHYGRCFGMPVFDLTIENSRIASLTLLRQAPCGATRQAAGRIIGLDIETAKTRIGLETQYFCSADPAGWDPVSGRSPLHLAGELHKAALVSALARQTVSFTIQQQENAG